MLKNKAFIFLFCTALTVSSIPAYGARVAKSSVSQNETGKIVKTAASASGTVTQALDLADLAQEDRISQIGEMCRLDYAKTGVLASVSAAQCILESGYLTTELATNANNCFGMKTELSQNDWDNSTWDGVSVYTKKTQEEYGGQAATVQADFRKYDSMEESVADHSAYLLGAKDGNGLRYEGLESAKDYKEAIQIIKDGGYATDSSYVDKVCSIIERYDLTKFDDLDGVEAAGQESGAAAGKVKASASGSASGKAKASASGNASGKAKASASGNASGKAKASASSTSASLAYRDGYYRVRKSWEDIDSQLGAFSVLENAKSVCKRGYKVFDSKGNVVYSYGS